MKNTLLFPSFSAMSVVMSDLGEHQANNVVELPGRRGPGRPKGVPNRVTRDVKAMARPYARKVFRRLLKLADESNDERVILGACKELLDRAFGKPPQPTLIGGTPDGEPIRTEAMSGHSAEESREAWLAFRDSLRHVMPAPAPVVPADAQERGAALRALFGQDVNPAPVQADGEAPETETKP